MDYYNLLGVEPTAHPEEIRMAFRRLAKRAHPDAHPRLSGPELEAMQRRFILLAQAYETLIDPGRRAAYDRKRPTAGARARKSGPASAAGTGRGPRTARKPRTARPPPPPPGGEEPDLESLKREVQELLDKFGLDMRQQFTEMMDKMLGWALSIFMEVVQALDARGREPSGDGAAEHTGRARPGRKETTGAAESGQHGPTARTAPQRGPSPAPEPDLEEELAALKKQVRANKGRARGHSPSRESVEEALQRIKDSKKS